LGERLAQRFNDRYFFGRQLPEISLTSGLGSGSSTAGVIDLGNGSPAVDVDDGLEAESAPLPAGVAQRIPLRNKRNECEAFEAYLVETVPSRPPPSCGRGRRTRMLPRYTQLSMRRSQ